MKIVVGIDERGGIGRNGDMPFRGVARRADLAHFRDTTRGGVVVMGRRKWESLSAPLTGRINVVVSRGHSPAIVVENMLGDAPVVRVDRFDTAVTWAESTGRAVWVVGGADVYRAAISDSRLVGAVVTRHAGDHACDTFFPWAELHRRGVREIASRGLLDGVRVHEYAVAPLRRAYEQKN